MNTNAAHPAQNPTCETCRWWVRLAGKQYVGECHRWPPQIIGYNPSHDGAFPVVGGSSFCGEHKATEE